MGGSIVEHEVNVRWGDIDSYGHVNNVRYLDYAAESRYRLMRDGLLAADAQVWGYDIDYVAQVVLADSPVTLACEIEASEVRQNLYVGYGAERRVHARMVTRLRPKRASRPVLDTPGVMRQDVPVRLHDLGPGDFVTRERAAELVQELRIAYRRELDAAGVWGKTVVAAVSVDYFGPLSYDAPTQIARTWTSRIGTSSFTVECEVSDGERSLLRASTVLVGWDAELQRSRPLTDAERACLPVTVPERSADPGPRR